jgi:hypothetical protein
MKSPGIKNIGKPGTIKKFFLDGEGKTMENRIVKNM